MQSPPKTMIDILNKVYEVRGSVDIYRSKNGDETENIQFYKINTREKISIKGSPFISRILASFDGKKSIKEIMCLLDIEPNREDVFNLIFFLEEKNIIITHEPKSECLERYTRQINFFDDWVVSKSGVTSQEELIKKKVIIFGVGAVGGTIALLLARAGVGKIALVDHKSITQASRERHYYFRKLDIGKSKVQALKENIRKINSSIEVITHCEKLVPTTSLEKIISNEYDIVINTADEPYIGHTTLKLGRYLWGKGIPLYVTGGFDAHLMSTGEFIIPGITPCADCCSNTFKHALKEWKPKYAQEPNKTNTDPQKKSINGSGGIASMSLFSSSYATSQIINFLVRGNSSISKLSSRGEYLFNMGTMTWIQLMEQEGCDFCSR